MLHQEKSDFANRHCKEMKRKIHVEPVGSTVNQGYVRWSARISGNRAWRWRPRNGVFFFEIPEEAVAEHNVPLSQPTLDCFLRATIFSAMEAHQTVAVHGVVSQSLLENLHEYQSVIHGWWPNFRPVDVIADEVVEGQLHGPNPNKTIMTFSGGLDSAYTLGSHKLGRRTDDHREIAACVFVHGFDIPLNDPIFDEAFGRAKQITDLYQTPLIRMRSNLKAMLPSWNLTHGAALAAVLSVFEGGFSGGLIAGTYQSADMQPLVAEFRYGSSAWSDPLLSSTSFPIVYDGDLPRVEKVAALRDEQELWKHLRVCWQGRDLSKNCGQCSKCIRLMLCMLAAGMDDLSNFETGLTDEMILAERGFESRYKVLDWQTCLCYVEQTGKSNEHKFKLMRRVLDRGVTTSLRQKLNKMATRWFEHWY